MNGETSWFSYQFFATVAVESWIGSGIKNVENAIVGETIAGDKIGGWDRLKLGVVGSVETLLVVLPLGKAATAVGGRVGGKIGAAALVNASIRNAMATDIAFLFGKSQFTKLATTRVGQGFLRAYSKVYEATYVKAYNSSFNKAIVGQKKQIGGAAQLAEGAPLETRLRANMKRTDAAKFTDGLKGELGEARTGLTFRRAGYEELPARLPRNQGFDGVWVKKNAEGEITDVILLESKFRKTGVPKLSDTKTKGRQLSDEWIEVTIIQMQASTDPSLRETARAIMRFKDQGGILRPKAGLLNPQGKLRFNKIKIPEGGLKEVPE